MQGNCATRPLMTPFGPFCNRNLRQNMIGIKSVRYCEVIMRLVAAMRTMEVASHY